MLGVENQVVSLYQLSEEQQGSMLGLGQGAIFVE